MEPKDLSGITRIVREVSRDDAAPEGAGGVPCRTLDRIAAHARGLHAVRRTDLSCGDRVVVRTRNSVYWLHALGGTEFYVSGGWFDRNGVAPMRTTIHGCTWGGTAILTETVAAAGLFLEFGNQVRTTRILSVEVHPLREDGTLH